MKRGLVDPDLPQESIPINWAAEIAAEIDAAMEPEEEPEYEESYFDADGNPCDKDGNPITAYEDVVIDPETGEELLQW